MKRRCILILAATLLGACSVADADAPTSGAALSTAPSAAVSSASPAVAVSSLSATIAVVRASPCPADMLLAGRFCVDRYEGHLLVIAADGASSVHPHHQRPAPGARYVAANAMDVFPQGYISRIESEEACAEAGKRLCSRSEWQLACRGTAHIRPRGDRPCNTGKAHLLMQMFNQPFRYDEHFNSPALNTTPGFLAKTGGHEECQSEIGAFDMVGNLHEWVSDTVSSAFIVQLESDGVQRQWQPSQVGNGIFMGGFYSTNGEHGPGCLFTTAAHEAAYHDYSTGFRCCKPVE